MTRLTLRSTWFAFVGLTLTTASLSLSPQQAYAQDDWSVSGGNARTGEIIRRYQQLLERNPTEGLAFRKMLEFAGTGSGLNRLIKTYEKKTKDNPKKSNYPIILGHLLKRKGDYDEALVAYDEALKRDPKSPLAYMGRGQMRFALQKNAEASADFEKALELEKRKKPKQEILRKLADLAFAQRQWDRAQEYYDRLVALEPRNEFLRLEYAQVLIKYKRYDRALDQYKVLLKLSGRDVKARATALRDMGELYELLGNPAEALKTYKKGQSYVRPSNWLYRELERRIVNVYRRDDKLGEYVAQKKKQWRSPSYEQAMLLGELVMEIGDEKAAYDYYKQAARRSGRATAPRLQMIQILKRRGDFKEVFAAYKSLIRISPRQPQFQFELAQLYLRNGKRDQAEKTLKSIRSKFRRDTDALTKLADTYMRLGMNKEALSVYKQLVRTDSRNESFIVSLGEFYFQNGDLSKATKTWEKILRSNLPKPQAHAQLGLLMVEHNMVERGIKHYEKAAKLGPKDLEILRGLAFAYESGRRWDKAIALWQGLMKEDAVQDAPVVAEARAQIITIYKHQNKLRTVMRDFRRDFESKPADLQAGRFLAAAYSKLNEPDRAIVVWKRIIQDDDKLDKSDVEGLMALEKLYAKTGDSKAAIEVLQKLADLRPSRAKEYYNRIADLSLSSYQDDQAVEYAKRALEKNPDDAAAQGRLGNVYAKMQRYDEAIKAYETAIDLDPRAFEVMMALAGLHLEKGEETKAMALYLKVAKSSNDESMILRASRLAMGLAKDDTGLEKVEALLAPQVFAANGKEVYRTILIEIYTQLLGPLISARNYSATPSPALLSKLDKVALRAYPVLMDAMQSGTTGQRLFAMNMLASLKISQAAPLLGQIASDKDSPLRMHAIVALAQIADARGNNGLIASLKSADSQVVDAAIWALGAAKDRRAIKALMDKLEAGQSSTQQALIAVSLGRLGAQEAAPALRKILETSRQTFFSDDAALAITYALGVLKDEKSLPLLIDVMTTSQSRAGDMAAWSLAQIGGAQAFNALTTSYWKDDAKQRQRGRQGLLTLSGVQESSPDSFAWVEEGRLIDARRQKFNLREFWKTLGDTAPLVNNAEIKAMFKTHQTALNKAVADALRHPESAVRIQVMRDLSSSYLGLGNAQESMKITPAWHSSIQGNVKGRTAQEAALAIGLLGQNATSSDKALVAQYLTHEDLGLRLASLDALAQSFGNDPSVIKSATEMLGSDSASVRAHAARALAKSSSTLNQGQTQSLMRLLESDPFLSVQVESAKTLSKHKSQEAIPLMSSMVEQAPFALQKELLRGLFLMQSNPKAGQALQEWRNHPDVRLRQAARTGR